MGNGFHIPSVVLFIVMLFNLPWQPTGYGLALQCVPCEGMWMNSFTQGTIWEWESAELAKLAPSAHTLFKGILDCFPCSFFPYGEVCRARDRLARVDHKQLNQFC